MSPVAINCVCEFLARFGASALLTSRVSIEMVQKAASLGTGIIIAVSAPTALAVKVATEANITLLAIARADGFEIFCHPERIQFNQHSLSFPRPSVIPAKAGISV